MILNFQHSFQPHFVIFKGKEIKWGKDCPMLILQLNSEEAAADKVPIAIGRGTEPHRRGLISALALGAGRLSPHSTGKSNYLEQGTRERSLWHL